MAQLPQAANVPGQNDQGLDDFTPLPAGDYMAAIISSEYKQTKKQNGNYLQIKWKLQDPAHKGRILFDNLNLDNPNPIAVEIANKALNSICKACGKVGVKDSEELHGIPCVLTLSVKAKTATQPASNDIKAYKRVTMEGAASLAGAGVVEGAASLGQPADAAFGAGVQEAPADTAAPPTTGGQFPNGADAPGNAMPDPAGTPLVSTPAVSGAVETDPSATIGAATPDAGTETPKKKLPWE